MWEKSSFNLGEFSPSDSLEIQVWDKDRLSKDDFMGRVIIALREVAEIGNHEKWFTLEQREKKNEEVTGDILLRFETRHLGVVPPSFGVDLDLLARRDSCDLPLFVSNILDVVAGSADDVPGLFRAPVPPEALAGLKSIVDAGGAVAWDSAERSPHHAAALLCLFLRELPLPLMTGDLTKKVLEAAREQEDSSSVAAKTRFILAILPEAHACLLTALLRCLRCVVRGDAAEARAVAQVLAPVLMGGAEQDAGQAALVETFFARLFAQAELYVPKPIVQGMDDHQVQLTSSDSSSSLLPGENAVTDLSIDSEAYKLFISYDIDKSNTIDRHEFGIFYTEFLKSLGRKQPSHRALRKIWAEVDANGNDEVSWEEFAHWWRSLQRSRPLTMSLGPAFTSTSEL